MIFEYPDGSGRYKQGTALDLKIKHMELVQTEI